MCLLDENILYIYIYPPQKHQIYHFNFQYDPLFGRHVVANRTIEVGEVIFNEEPIVSTIQGGGRHVDREIVSTPSCHNCLRYIKSGLVPCPTCNIACFCR